MKDRCGGRVAATVLAVMVLLGGCGGGGSAEPSPPPVFPGAEGAYRGVMTGSVTGQFRLLVLENDELWGFYGEEAPAGFVVAGVVHGHGQSNAGQYASADLRNLRAEPTPAGTARAVYDPAAGVFTGRLEVGGAALSLAGEALPAGGFRYDTPATLAALSGQWSLVTLDGERLDLSVLSGGAVSVVAPAACTAGGSIVPRPSGKNVFDVRVDFGPAPCPQPWQVVSGIAVLAAVPGGQQLLLATHTTDGRAGMAASGVR